MDLDFAIFDWTQKIASLLKFRSKDKFYVVFAFFSFCIFLRFPPLTFDVLLFQCSARATVVKNGRFMQLAIPQLDSAAVQ